MSPSNDDASAEPTDDGPESDDGGDPLVRPAFFVVGFLLSFVVVALFTPWGLPTVALAAVGGGAGALLGDVVARLVGGDR